MIPRRLLIAGCGYLGQRVAQRWRAAGGSVAALTRRPSRAAELAGEGITPILGDVADAAALPPLPPCDAVLFAVGYDRTSGVPQRRVYVDGLRNFIGRLDSLDVPFLYISSTGVYSQSRGEWVDEESPAEPTREGGRLCLEAEQVVLQAMRHARILRLAGIYGPGRLIARAEQLRSGTALPYRGDAWLNLIHVDDAASAACALLENEPVSEGTAARRIWLGVDDRPVRRSEFYGRLAECLGAPVPLFAAADDDGLGKRCSNHRLRTEWGWPLRYPTIETGLPQAVHEARST